MYLDTSVGRYSCEQVQGLMYATDVLDMYLQQCLYSSVAERWSCKPKVMSSILIGGKQKFYRLKNVVLTPTWFEHAAFWSGVRRATVAPRSRTESGSTEIWTRIAGFKVQSANHYTMGPCVTCDFALIVYKSGAQGQWKKIKHGKQSDIAHIFALTWAFDLKRNTLEHINP